MPFTIEGREHFKGAGFLKIDWEDEGATSALSVSDMKLDVQVFREKLYYDPDLDYLASDYDSRVEHLKPGTRLEGLFQSEIYFYGKDSMLKQWLSLSDSMLDVATKYKDFCILNIRGGEYKRHRNLILPQSYWVGGIRNIRKQTGIDQFLIVTDDRAYAKALFPSMPVLEGSVADCYAALHGAHCHVVSNSSFSYFPIKTREDSPFVIAPYLWSRFGNPYRRWAAPANLYKKWHWQDGEGLLHSYDQCIEVRDQTREFYLNQYNINIPQGALQSDRVLRRIPQWIKNPTKLILSKIFPRLIG